MDKFLELMKKLNISQVYWVDDENATGSELDLQKLSNAFVSALISANSDEAKNALGLIRREQSLRKYAEKMQNVLQGENEDDDSKAERIESILSDVIENAEDASNILVEGLRKLPGPLRGAEKDALISLFTKKCGVDWEWRPLSFSKWEEQKKEVLASNDSRDSVLFVVDLQNNSESTAANGRSVLGDLAAANLDRKSCHLVVFTSECKDNQEFGKGRALTEEYFEIGKKRIPVFVLSKHRFATSAEGADSKMVSAFVSALERADLSLVQLEFANIMREHFIKSIDVAFNAFESLTIEELMFAVTHTSKSEGVSEVETLLRLMNIAHREEFQRVIAESADLRSAIIKLRNARIPINRNDLGADAEIIKLRCAELYDKPEVINRLYSPVAPGDLFALKKEEVIRNEGGIVVDRRLGDEQLYVVAANACDLMLRENGKRKLDHCVLLRLDDVGDGADRQFSFWLRHLEFTKVANAGRKQIELRHYASVPLTVLDLCWTNADGLCVWSKHNSSAAIENLLDSQRARLETLNDAYRSADKLEITGMARPLNIGVEVLAQEGKAIDEAKFGMRRVGRLSHSHAAQLVTRFTSVFGRPSEQHDFSHSA